MYCIPKDTPAQIRGCTCPCQPAGRHLHLTPVQASIDPATKQRPVNWAGNRAHHAPARFNGRRFVAGGFIPRRCRMWTNADANIREISSHRSSSTSHRRNQPSRSGSDRGDECLDHEIAKKPKDTKHEDRETGAFRDLRALCFRASSRLRGPTCPLHHPNIDATPPEGLLMGISGDCNNCGASIYSARRRHNLLAASYYISDHSAAAEFTSTRFAYPYSVLTSAIPKDTDADFAPRIVTSVLKDQHISHGRSSDSDLTVRQMDQAGQHARPASPCGICSTGEQYWVKSCSNKKSQLFQPKNPIEPDLESSVAQSAQGYTESHIRLSL